MNSSYNQFIAFDAMGDNDLFYLHPMNSINFATSPLTARKHFQTKMLNATVSNDLNFRAVGSLILLMCGVCLISAGILEIVWRVEKK